MCAKLPLHRSIGKQGRIPETLHIPRNRAHRLPNNKRGRGKPETFTFLGFTHICGRTRRGGFLLRSGSTINSGSASSGPMKDRATWRSWTITDLDRHRARLVGGRIRNEEEISSMAKHRTRTPPGEILNEEFLKPHKLSANALALALRVPANRITGIVNGSRAMTADTALRLARYFGMSAQFWMNAQAAYDLSKAEAETGAAIANDVQPRAA
jgi:addiction module HigA family antidote